MATYHLMMASRNNKHMSQEDNKMRRITEELVNSFVEGNTLAQALMQLTADTKEQIETALDNMYESDLFDILQEFNGDLHRMDELDEVYSHLSATEVLENLSDIDLRDDYFNSDTNTSGNDIWDVSEVSIEHIITSIYNGSFYIDDDDDTFNDIFEEERLLKEAITDRFKVYDKAKELFDMAMKQNPQEVMALLWNMNA